MNTFNPEKLAQSKWTAVQPHHKEKHFIVTKLIRSDSNCVIGCELEAIINRQTYQIDWQTLKDDTHWLMGWR